MILKIILKLTKINFDNCHITPLASLPCTISSINKHLYINQLSKNQFPAETIQCEAIIELLHLAEEPGWKLNMVRKGGLKYYKCFIFFVLFLHARINEFTNFIGSNLSLKLFIFPCQLPLLYSRQ